MTKIKNPYGSPSRFYCNFSLSDLQKLSNLSIFDPCRAMPRGIGYCNKIRSTILYNKNVVKQSQKVPEHHKVRKIPYLFSNF